MMLGAFKAVCRGASHIANGKPLQDAAKAVSFAHSGIACAADGHGGIPYFRSDRGSLIAVNVAVKVLVSVLRRIPGLKGDNAAFERLLKLAEKAIVACWREIVLQDLVHYPFTNNDFEFCKENQISLQCEHDCLSVYGTTLLCGFMAKNAYGAIQLGDGACTVITKDGARLAIPKDPRCEMGMTTSLCNTDAENCFQHCFGSDPILGITVATDGVADSFLPQNYLDFTNTVLEDFVKRPKLAEQELLSFLPRLSSQGSQDDCTLAGIFNFKAITQTLKLRNKAKGVNHAGF